MSKKATAAKTATKKPAARKANTSPEIAPVTTPDPVVPEAALAEAKAEPQAKKEPKPKMTDEEKKTAAKIRRAERRGNSTVETPVKVVWETAEAMVGARRKDVVAACVSKGVGYYTAATQFQRWSKSKASK